jgi:hypothetical protein
LRSARIPVESSSGLSEGPPSKGGQQMADEDKRLEKEEEQEDVEGHRHSRR